MRTTIDIPEEILRRAKSEAALRGMKLKDYVTEAVRAALDGGLMTVAERAPAYGVDERQDLGGGCFFPIVRGPGGRALRDLTSARVHELLEKEETQAAAHAPDPS